MTDSIAKQMQAEEMRRLIDSIYWHCKRYSSSASGPAAHHLAVEVVGMIEEAKLEREEHE